MSLKIKIPRELIASHPLEKRSESRMLVYHRDQDKILHHYFHEIIQFYQSGDLILTNNTKVMKARLIGNKESGGKIELFLIHPLNESGQWKVLIKPAKKVQVGTKIYFDQTQYGEVIQKLDSGMGFIQFWVSNWDQFINQFGKVPLPPYIKRIPENEDEHRYQTVYAQHLGAIAAPTAGLHFDESMIQQLKEKEIGFESVTLHVGLGTFMPVTQEQIQTKKLHEEKYEILPEIAQKIHQVFESKHRLLSVGTTVVRTLESSASGKNQIKPQKSITNLFIQPSYEFNILDQLLTNFHLSDSSLIYLVEAVIGEKKLNQIYQEAIDQRYRFFSYGDCMLIL